MQMALHDSLKTAIVTGGAGGTDASAVTGKGWLYGFVISGAAGAVELWDNTSAATQQLSAGNALAAYFLPIPIHFQVGIFVVLAANQIVTVFYQDQP